jgi:hypothetical protein
MASGLKWTPSQLAEFEARKEVRVAQAKRKIQALGRLKSGEMNKSEAKYAQRLEARKMMGEVAWYAFEKVKLILGPNTSLTIDFFVMLASGELEAHDVKGSKAMMTDDSWAKIKIAAGMFPFRFFLCCPVKGGDWDIEEV